MSQFRTLAIAGLVLGLAFLFSSPVRALVVTGSPTTSALPPTDDPGWNSFTIGGNVSRNSIYLGNGWALSAKHVGPEPNEVNPTLSFSTGTFGLIPGQNYIVPNPTGTTPHAQADLRLVRLNADPGLPSIFVASPQFTIASQPVTDSIPENQRQVVIIGHGRTRDGSPTNWNSSWEEVPPFSGPVQFSGYKAMDPNDDTKRWGTNLIANEDPIFGGIDTDLRYTVNRLFGDGVNRSTVSLVTTFDSAGLMNEAQAVDKDSGSAVFFKRGGQWELLGIVHSAFTYSDSNPNTPDQPLFTAVYGNVTAFADLSFYRGEILNIIDSHPNYSAVGDVNLNGVVSGTGAGPAATDDVTAFIQGIDGPGAGFQGWGYNNGLGTATITSWKNGDIAHVVGVGTCEVSLGGGLCAGGDGKTDVYDFLALRGAINNPMGLAALEQFFNSLSANPDGSVPEPSAAALACVAALFLCCGARRRPGRM